MITSNGRLDVPYSGVVDFYRERTFNVSFTKATDL